MPPYMMPHSVRVPQRIQGQKDQLYAKLHVDQKQSRDIRLLKKAIGANDGIYPFSRASHALSLTTTGTELTAGVNIGDQHNMRDGASILLKKLRLRFRIGQALNGALYNPVVRVILIKSRKASTLFTMANIQESGGTLTSEYNSLLHGEEKEFEVLYDKTHHLQASNRLLAAAVSPQETVQTDATDNFWYFKIVKNFKKGLKINWISDTVNPVTADTGTNHLQLFIQAEPNSLLTSAEEWQLFYNK